MPAAVISRTGLLVLQTILKLLLFELNEVRENEDYWLQSRPFLTELATR